MQDDRSIVETRAIALRIYPFSKTSHVVVWLTEDGRRVVTTVKGAVRPKSAFLGQYDLYYTCDLLYYSRSHDGVHVARECEAENRRDGLRANWRAELYASWFASLADLVSENGVASRSLFALLSESLDVLAALPPRAAPPQALFARYEARLLALSGLRPNFSGAAAYPKSARNLPLDIAEGRIRAPGEAGDPERPSSPVVRVSRRTLALCETLLDSPSVGTESTSMRDDDAATGVIRLLGIFMQYHLPDADPAARAIALNTRCKPRLPAV